MYMHGFIFTKVWYKTITRTLLVYFLKESNTFKIAVAISAMNASSNAAPAYVKGYPVSPQNLVKRVPGQFVNKTLIFSH